MFSQGKRAESVPCAVVGIAVGVGCSGQARGYCGCQKGQELLSQVLLQADPVPLCLTVPYSCLIHERMVVITVTIGIVRRVCIKLKPELDTIAST